MKFDDKFISTKTETDGIHSSLRTIASTPYGTTPFLRDMGLKKCIPNDLSDLEKNEYVSQILTQADIYEDRAKIKQISFDNNEVCMVIGGDGDG